MRRPEIRSLCALLLLTAFAAVCVPSAAAAQLGIQPAVRAGAQDPAPQGGDLPALMNDLRTKDAWWSAAAGLADLARTRQMAVLTELSALARTAGEQDLAARARAVIAQIVAGHAAAEKRAEMRGRFRALEDAAADLQKTVAAAGDPQVQKAAAALQKALAALRESVAADEALDPAPLRVPAGRRAAPAAQGARPQGAQPEGGQPEGGPKKAPGDLGGDGYRMIEVDGKTFLVPKRDLPDGVEYEASFENGSLVIRRLPQGSGNGGGAE